MEGEPPEQEHEPDRGDDSDGVQCHSAAGRDRREREHQCPESYGSDRQSSDHDHAEQGELAGPGRAALHRCEGELGDDEEAGPVERRALVDGPAADEEEPGVLRAEEQQSEDCETRAPKEAGDQQRNGRSRAAGAEQAAEPFGVEGGVAGERSGPEGGRCGQRQTRASLAWRLNAVTSSIGAASGSPSRHSATGTPAAAYSARNASRWSFHSR